MPRQKTEPKRQLNMRLTDAIRNQLDYLRLRWRLRTRTGTVEELVARAWKDEVAAQAAQDETPLP